MTLRSKLIRLAHAKPELRPAILPILKSARIEEGAIKALETLISQLNLPVKPNAEKLLNGDRVDVPVPSGYETAFEYLYIELRPDTGLWGANQKILVWGIGTSRFVEGRCPNIPLGRIGKGPTRWYYGLQSSLKNIPV